MAPDIPLDWLEKKLQRVLSEEEKAALKKLGGPEALQKRLQELLKEQKEWHGGGNKWIGAGGSSPFGHSGYHPEGIRIGGESAGNRTAIKVWEAREFKDYDSDLSLGTRNIKMALRCLRRFAREGSNLELDLDKTIHSTAANAGMLDIQMRPERHNQVKVLLLMDVADLWMIIFNASLNYSPPSKLNSNTWSITTFITACMNTFGKAIVAEETK